MKRSEIREQIFKLLFRVEFIEAEEMPVQVELFLGNPSIETDENNFKDIVFTEDEEKYIKDKYEKILEKLPEIDKLIDETAKGWTASRLGKVDLTILRLAIYELEYDDEIPTGVAIDQAVELAKKFGRDESSSFINGILAKLAK